MPKPDKLRELFDRWQVAQQRLQMAQQTVAGATAQAIEAESRFKGVAEYLYGSEFTFKFEGGKLTFNAHGNPGGKANGKALEMTPQQLTRAARRAQARGRAGTK